MHQSPNIKIGVTLDGEQLPLTKIVKKTARCIMEELKQLGKEAGGEWLVADSDRTRKPLVCGNLNGWPISHWTLFAGEVYTRTGPRLGPRQLSPVALELRSDCVLNLTTFTPPRHQHVNLKVVTQDGNEIFFKCMATTSLSKLMHAFCQRQGVSLPSVSFLFDGRRIHESFCPVDCDMEDGDVIDVMVEQQGD